MIPGGSGYTHQIDVSVRSKSRLLLIECKLLKGYAGVNSVLVLRSRIMDVREANPELEVLGSIVSTKRPTAGAWLLAKYYGIRLDTARDVGDYAISIGSEVFGIKSAVVSTSATLELKVIRKSETDG